MKNYKDYEELREDYEKLREDYKELRRISSKSPKVDRIVRVGLVGTFRLDT